METFDNLVIKFRDFFFRHKLVFGLLIFLTIGDFWNLMAVYEYLYQKVQVDSTDAFKEVRTAAIEGVILFAIVAVVEKYINKKYDRFIKK